VHLLSRIIWLILAPACSWADDPPKKSLKEVIITATRFEQDPKELPIGVSVISAEQIKNSAAYYSNLPAYIPVTWTEALISK